MRNPVDRAADALEHGVGGGEAERDDVLEFGEVPRPDAARIEATASARRVQVDDGVAAHDRGDLRPVPRRPPDQRERPDRVDATDGHRTDERLDRWIGVARGLGERGQ